MSIIQNTNKTSKIIKKNKFVNLSKADNDNLSSFSKLEKDEVLKKLNTNIDGLKLEDIEPLKEKYGTNSISIKKTDRWYHRLIGAFFNPFSLVLLIIAILTVIVPYMGGGIKNSDWISFAIIISMVIVSAVIKIFQEGKSSKASKKLQDMIKTTTAIKRNGLIKETSIEEVLPGDIIKLAAGDMIPADMRIIQAKDLFVTQSSLTGESEPVEKFAYANTNNSSSALETNNLCFMGTSVSSGSALGVVINTGKATFFGKIARMINKKPVKSSFDKGITKVSFLLIWTMLVMSMVIFIIVGARHNQWLTALNFALAVAIGITPQMLPMIVTINLAKEAYKLSKQQTIVKNINSIQSFGAMDVLCTDKTGTLTEDKIILERHINLEGDEDNRVLTYAFLNSYYQTGLKNLVDLAVIDKANKLGIDDPIMGFEKVDEIPFDFHRKRMSVIISDKQKQKQLITKGAYEEIITICNYAEYKGKIVMLTNEIKTQAIKIANKLNSEGMRVIGIAINHDELPESNFQANNENNMILVGFIALLDPPKETAKDAIMGLQKKGVMVKVLTGDNDVVTKYICKTVGIDSSNVLLGSDIANMNDEELKKVVMNVNVFTKLSPEQKQKVVLAIKANNHVVGFMGDGINDAAAMRAADIGISVDTAVDIAKESADIILLEKDLTILEHGVVEGRKAVCNIIKYIKTTVSSSFGNMLSMLVGACWLPSEPMITTQILILNMIYEFSQYFIPWDNVDNEYYTKPRQWDPKSIFKFMICIGPVSSVFDIASFAIMYFGFKWNTVNDAAYFSTGWFYLSLLTQTAIVYVLRTAKVPFFQSSPSAIVSFSLFSILLIGLILVLTQGLDSIGFHSLITTKPIWLLYGLLLTGGYMACSQLTKTWYIKLFKEWL